VLPPPALPPARELVQPSPPSPSSPPPPTSLGELLRLVVVVLWPPRGSGAAPMALLLPASSAGEGVGELGNKWYSGRAASPCSCRGRSTAPAPPALVGCKRNVGNSVEANSNGRDVVGSSGRSGETIGSLAEVSLTTGTAAIPSAGWSPALTVPTCPGAPLILTTIRADESSSNRAAWRIAAVNRASPQKYVAWFSSPPTSGRGLLLLTKATPLLLEPLVVATARAGELLLGIRAGWEDEVAESRVPSGEVCGCGGVGGARMVGDGSGAGGKGRSARSKRLIGRPGAPTGSEMSSPSSLPVGEASVVAEAEATDVNTWATVGGACADAAAALAPAVGGVAERSVRSDVGGVGVRMTPAKAPQPLALPAPATRRERPPPPTPAAIPPPPPLLLPPPPPAPTAA